MKLTQTKKDENDIEFTAYFDKTGKISFEESILTAFLIYFGFTEANLVDEFSLKYYNDKTKFTSLILKAIRDDSKVYADNLKEAQTKGFAAIRFTIPISMQADIISFLANATRNVANRLEDAGHQITSGAYDSLVGIGKNMKEAGGDVLGGLGNIAEGTFGGMTSPIGSSKFNDSWKRFGEGGRQFGKGMGKGLLQTPLDAFALNFLKHLSAFQTVSFFESAGRLLLPSEETLLSSIFGNSVVYGAIRIKSGYAGAIHLGEDSSNELGKYWLYNTRPITIGNTIYMKDTDPLGWDATLVHEATHVWQHQNGGTDYMSEALYAQFTAGYGYGDDIFNKNKTWAMLNPEQQGQLIEDAFVNGFFPTTTIWTGIKPVYDNSRNLLSPSFLLNYMQKVITQLRNGQGAT